MRAFVPQSRVRLGVATVVVAMLMSVVAVAMAPAASALCSGATLTLAPTAQTVGVGGTATLTATFTDSCGPVSGETVLFGAFSGPNAGKGGSGPTNASGQTSFSYSSTLSGTDVWLSAWQNPAGGTLFSNAATVTWAVVQTGRAYGIAASGLVKITPRPDTGPVAATGDSDTFPPCTVNVPTSPTIVANTLCARVLTGFSATGGTDPGSLALAAVEQAQLNITGLPAIVLSAVNAISGTQCDGNLSYSSIGYLKIGPNLIIGAKQQPKPNTTYNLGIGKLILNEQLPVPGADKGSTVNAVHLMIPGTQDIVLASATSDVHGCPK